MASPINIDLKKTIAVLIGASKFVKGPKKLPDLPGVKNNIKDLAMVLRNKKIVGIPDKNVVEILDEAHPNKILMELVKACRKAKDTLIVYYAGHGIVSKNSHSLCLATTETTDEDADYNAIEFEKIREAISETSAGKKILIIDSCFSGRALKEVGSMSSSPSALRTNLNIKGTYAIASAPANRKAFAPPNEHYTAFSGALIDTLNNGVGNGHEGINLLELYEQVRDKLRDRKSVPEPEKANVKEGNNIVIARNIKFITPIVRKESFTGEPLKGIVEILYHCHKLLKEAEKAGGSIWFAGLTFAFGPAHQIQKISAQWTDKYPKVTSANLSDEFNAYFLSLLGGTIKYTSEVKLVALKKELIEEKFINPLYKKKIYAEHLERYPEHLYHVKREIKDFQDKIEAYAKIYNFPIHYVEDMEKQAIVTEISINGNRKKEGLLLEVGTKNIGKGESKGFHIENSKECEKLINYVEDLYNSGES